MGTRLGGRNQELCRRQRSWSSWLCWTWSWGCSRRWRCSDEPRSLCRQPAIGQARKYRWWFPDCRSSRLWAVPLQQSPLWNSSKEPAFLNIVDLTTSTLLVPILHVSDSMSPDFLTIALSQYEGQVVVDQFVSIVVEGLVEEEIACFQ